jgi:hypothetical protein
MRSRWPGARSRGAGTGNQEGNGVRRGTGSGTFVAAFRRSAGGADGRCRDHGRAHRGFAGCSRALLIRILPVASATPSTGQPLPGRQGARRSAGPAAVRANAREAWPAVMMVLVVFPGRLCRPPGRRGPNGGGGSVTFQDSDDGMNVQPPVWAWFRCSQRHLSHA